MDILFLQFSWTLAVTYVLKVLFPDRLCCPIGGLRVIPRCFRVGYDILRTESHSWVIPERYLNHVAQLEDRKDSPGGIMIASLAFVCFIA